MARSALPSVRRFGIVGGALAISAVGVGVLPARAAQPVIHHETVQSSYTLDANLDIGCSANPDFLIQVNGVDMITAQTFYDKSGNVVRTVVHDDFTGTEAANGVTLNSSEHATITDYPNGTESWVGQPLKVSLPGGGNVILDVGKLVYNPDGSIAVQHGPHPFADGDVSAYCAAFGA